MTRTLDVTRPEQPVTCDLATNYPTTPSEDVLVRDALAAVLADPAVPLGGTLPPTGRPEDVAAVRAALRPRLAPDAALALTGSGQSALAAAFAAALAVSGRRAGSRPARPRAAVDAWTFSQALGVLARLGATVVALPSDADGLVPAALAEVCAAGRVDVLYAMPTVHNPRGTVLPAARRAELAAIARAHDVWLVEDDAYAFLADGWLTTAPPDGVRDGAPSGARVPTLAALAPERTFQAFSLSKIVSRALRLGAVATPPAVAGAVEAVLRVAGTSAHPAAAAAAARLGASGAFARLATEKRAEGAVRQALARQHLGPALAFGSPYAWHGVLALRPGSAGGSGRQFAAAAAGVGVAVTPAASYQADGGDAPAVRVSLGSEADRDRLADGLGRVATLWAR